MNHLMKNFLKSIKKFLTKPQKPNPESVNLLASILVCYPEVSAIRFNQKEKTIQFSFTLKKDFEPEFYEEFIKFLQESIMTFHHLESIQHKIISFSLEKEGEIIFLHITRDFASLWEKELDLISRLLREKLSDCLLFDDDEIDPEEMLEEKDENQHTLHRLLLNLKTNAKKYRLRNMIAIREDNRVLIFDQ